MDPSSPYQPSRGTYDVWKGCCTVVDVPSKREAVDRKMVQDISAFADENGRSPDKAVVILTADGDYEPWIEKLRSVNLPVILIHRGNVKSSGGMEMACNFVFDNWDQLVADATESGTGSSIDRPSP